MKILVIQSTLVQSSITFLCCMCLYVAHFKSEYIIKLMGCYTCKDYVSRKEMLNNLKDWGATKGVIL
jgi:hypothetical protein